MNKIKVLSIGKKKNEIRKKKGTITVQDYIEKEVPGLYIFRKAYIENAINEIKATNPDIIWIHQDGQNDYTELITEIKKLNFTTVILVIITGIIEDEQEMKDRYLMAGAYKCYFVPPLILDELIHDMYVSKNLE